MFVQFVVDNRLMPCQDFHTEASYGSYQRNVTTLLGKYCVLSTVYSWLNPPVSIAFALSPDKVRIVQNAEWNVSQLGSLLEPKYSCMGSFLIPKTTWGVFFVDALHKLLDLHRKLQRTTVEVGEEHPWYLFSTELSLLGDHRSTCVEEGLETFCKVCNTIREQATGVRIHIICTLVAPDQHAPSSNPNMIKVLSKLGGLREFVSFHTVVNSALHFDEELRGMASQNAPRLCAKLEFPMQFGSNCSLVMQLSPSTGTAGNTMHAGLRQPELCSLALRSQISPAFIDGKALHVTCPSITHATEHLTTERSHHQNQLTFRSVARFLAHRDTLLILRVPCALPDSSLSNDQYWALVPPPADPTQHPSGKDVSLGVPSEEGQWAYMQLLKLVDADDILAPRSHLLDTARSTSSTPGVSSVPQVTPVKRPEDTQDAQSIDTTALGDDQAARAAQLQDEEMMLDVEEYLQSSLESSLGPPSRYNPAFCSSGSINNMFMMQSRGRVPAAPPQVASEASTTGHLVPRKRTAHQVLNLPAEAAPASRGLTFATKPSSSTSNTAPAAATKPQQQQQQLNQARGGGRGVSGGAGRGGRGGGGGRRKSEPAGTNSLPSDTEDPDYTTRPNSRKTIATPAPPSNASAPSEDGRVDLFAAQAAGGAKRGPGRPSDPVKQRAPTAVVDLSGADPVHYTSHTSSTVSARGAPQPGQATTVPLSSPPTLAHSPVASAGQLPRSVHAPAMREAVEERPVPRFFKRKFGGISGSSTATAGSALDSHAWIDEDE